MNNTNINIASGSKLTWTNGDVKVENPLANSHLTIASGAQFLIEASGGTWGMTDYRDPAYFGVHNRGTVTVNATGRATILGNYDSTSLTRIESGDLLIYGLAEQTRGSFELRNNSMVTVGPPDMALRIYGGTIVGTGTVNANLTLGLLGGGQSQGYISPGIDTIPASPGAAPNVYGIGKITVVGSFHIFNGGMTVDYDATGNYDKVVVQGTYGALKGSLFVRGDNNYKPAQPVTMAFLTAALFYDDFSPPTSSGIAFWMAPNGMDTNTFRIKKYATSYVIETYTIISPH